MGTWWPRAVPSTSPNDCSGAFREPRSRTPRDRRGGLHPSGRPLQRSPTCVTTSWNAPHRPPAEPCAIRRTPVRADRRRSPVSHATSHQGSRGWPERPTNGSRVLQPRPRGIRRRRPGPFGMARVGGHPCSMSSSDTPGSHPPPVGAAPRPSTVSRTTPAPPTGPRRGSGQRGLLMRCSGTATNGSCRDGGIQLVAGAQ